MSVRGDPEVLRYRRLLQGGFGLLALGFAAKIGYGFAVDGSAAVAMFGVLIALATLAVGLLLGFVFGVPRANQKDGDAKRGGYAVNTNLEQISDWLTKIIVGVGLVQFGTIITHYEQLNGKLAAGLGGKPASGAVAGVLIAFFGTLGFLLGHIVTRTSVMSTFRYFDRLAAGEVTKSLRELRSSLTSLHSSIVVEHREADAAVIDPTEMTVEHNREPFIPVPRLDVGQITDLVELQTHLEGQLCELIAPLSPRSRTTADMIGILVRRGVLDQPAAESLAELLAAAQRVAGGAELSPEAAARPGLLHSNAIAGTTVPRVDAIVSRGSRSVFVEVRARVRTGDYRHLVPLQQWLYELPERSKVLLVLLGDGFTAFETDTFGRDGLTVDVLLWDMNAEAWPRVMRLLRSE